MLREALTFTSHFRTLVVPLIIALGVVSTAHASTLWVGNDINTPVERYTTGNVSLGYWGQNGATGSALDGAGHVYTVAPSFGNNVIKKYDAAQNEVGSFVAAVSGNWIEDMTYGGGDALWVSTFEGNVFHIDGLGNVLSSFVSGGSFVGVTTDGTHLYTTTGFFGDDTITKRLFDGTVVSVVHTGFAGGAGLGYDATDGTFWVGYLGGLLRQFDPAGNLLTGFVTANNTFPHDGLEVGEIFAVGVPEPSTSMVLGAGLAGLAGAAWSRRRN